VKVVREIVVNEDHPKYSVASQVARGLSSPCWR
jgi:hypothetical protein